MTAMIPADILTPAEIAEAERDAWATAICDDCGQPMIRHDDGECPPPPCRFCYDLGYFYPSQDPADDRESCPLCRPKE